MGPPDSTQGRSDARALLFSVSDQQAGTRLDKYLAANIAGLGRAEAKRLIAAGKVRVNHRRVKPAEPLRSGDRIEVEMDPGALGDWAPVPCPDDPLAVVHTDPWLVVVDKPCGVPCHPLVPAETGTVANALVARFPECPEASSGGGGRAREAGLCHRLDTPTSGLLLAARTAEAFTGMRKAFGSGAVTKVYLAVVDGAPPAEGILDAPLLQRKGTHKKVQVAPYDGSVRLGARDRLLEAETRFRLVRQLDGYALLAVRIRTGRRHQIRAHLAFAGHPLVGDDAYGTTPAPPRLSGLPGGPGLLLRAHRITAPHPADGSSLTFTAPPDPAFADLLPDPTALPDLED